MPMLLEIWLKASSRKPIFMPSTIGRRPVMAAPTAMPVKLFSAIGVSSTRSSPYLACKSLVTL